MPKPVSQRQGAFRRGRLLVVSEMPSGDVDGLLGELSMLQWLMRDLLNNAADNRGESIQCRSQQMQF